MSLRISDQQVEKLQRVARRLNQRSPSAAIHLLLEEKLREEEHPHIYFRDSPSGREAAVMGTGLAVWETLMTLRSFDGEVAQTAAHLQIPTILVEAAMSYRDSFPDEVTADLEYLDSMNFEKLKQMLPNLEEVTVPSDFEIDESVT